MISCFSSECCILIGWLISKIAHLLMDTMVHFSYNTVDVNCYITTADGMMCHHVNQNHHVVHYTNVNGLLIQHSTTDNLRLNFVYH